jgi:cell pole-organizing protein PopZ
MVSSEHEPTMEEILASIRKIISEDSADAAGTTPSDMRASEPDVLDLTHEVHEEFAGGDGTMHEPESHETPVEHVAAAPGEEASVNNEPPSHSSEGIFSEKTRKVLSDALANLEPAGTRSEPGKLPAPNGLSVEAVFERAVRETFDPVLRKWLADNADPIIEHMKPVISEWLDHHFPAMLEDAVRNEVARAVMARGRR